MKLQDWFHLFFNNYNKSFNFQDVFKELNWKKVKLNKMNRDSIIPDLLSWRVATVTRTPGHEDCRQSNKHLCAHRHTHTLVSHSGSGEQKLPVKQPRWSFYDSSGWNSSQSFCVCDTRSTQLQTQTQRGHTETETQRDGLLRVLLVEMWRLKCFWSKQHVLLFSFYVYSHSCTIFTSCEHDSSCVLMQFMISNLYKHERGQ